MDQQTTEFESVGCMEDDADQAIRHEEAKMCQGRKCSLAFLCILNAILVVLTVPLGFAAEPTFNCWIPGLFLHGLTNVSDTFYVDISPVHGFYCVWALIFLFQVPWVLYSMTGFCRTTGDGLIYFHPVLLSHAFYVCFSLGLLFAVGWMFLWDRLFISLALVAILCSTALLFIALAISYRLLDHCMPLLYVQGRHFDTWCIRILVQNGIALFANWAVIQSLWILSAVLTYASQQSIQGKTASVISLSIMGGYMVIYSLTDYFAFSRYSIYVVTPYIAWVVALSGMFVNNSLLLGVNPIFIVVLFAASGVLSVTKLYFICLRQITKASDAEETTEFLRELDESRHLLK